MQGWKKDYSRYKNFFLNFWVYYNTKPNVKIYLELMLSLGTVIVFSIFAIRPTVLTIIDIYEQIKSKEAVISKLEQKIRNLQSANRLLQSNTDSLSLIDEAIPNNPNLEKIIMYIETLANDSSVNLNSISTSEVNVKGLSAKKQSEDTVSLPANTSGLPLSISISGQYENVIEFLSNIESSRRPFKIDSITFNAIKQDEQVERTITLTISARLPYLLLVDNNGK